MSPKRTKHWDLFPVSWTKTSTMKKQETIFSENSFTDSRKKVNRLDKTVPRKYLDQIEEGVTLEQLNEMQKDGYPIFKYATQITIHGKFPEMGNHYIHGYKNLIQNKNKSVGIKYNAIDEDKRQFIAERLVPLGFRYHRDSSDISFEKTWKLKGYHGNDLSIYEQDAKALKEAKELASFIDGRYFFGSKHLWTAELWGVKYLVLSLRVGAIYQKDIEPFLNTMSATQKVLDDYNQKLEDQRIEREQAIEKRQKEREAKQAELRKQIEPIMKQLEATYGEPVVKTGECGTFLRVKFDHNDNVQFRVRHVYLPKGKRVKRWNEETIELSELSEYVPNEKEYMDSTFRGKTTGFRLAKV